MTATPTPTRVYYLGPEGTFCHAAALTEFQSAEDAGAAELCPCRDIGAVFEAVRDDQNAQAVVPIENSIEGSVNLTLEELLRSEDVKIVGEQVVAVEQCLLGEGPQSAITTVRSHPHGLAQCKRWLREHLPHANLVATGSTAQAALEVKGDKTSAAIASELAGKLACVPVLERSIQDRRINATRFLVLGRHTPAPTGKDKTSLVFGARHEQGALYQALGVFERQKLNLSRIESRPNPNQIWEYIFYADLDGHEADPAVSRALHELQDGRFFRLLGSYPQADASLV